MTTTQFISRYFLDKSPAEPLAERVAKAREAIADADYVVIGAGAGLSAAAGLDYDGEVFKSRFADMIERYGFTDLYSSSFYDFATEEERWAYWARHIAMCRFEPGALPLYKALLETVSHKDYFVITTNVDGQFRKSGFAGDRIFEVQGDYGYIQCAHGCHQSRYYAEAMVNEMLANEKDGRIPTNLVPHCPVCGGPMDINIRKDSSFVEDDLWHDSLDRYQDFMQRAKSGKTVLLELGVGFNTPSIIRFPFEQQAAEGGGFTLIRLNKDFADSHIYVPNFISFAEDMQQVIAEIAS